MFSTTLRLHSVFLIIIFITALSSCVVWFFMRNDVSDDSKSSVTSESSLSNQNGADKSDAVNPEGQLQDTRTFFQEIIEKELSSGQCEVTENGVSFSQAYGQVAMSGTVRLQFPDQKATYIVPPRSGYAYIMTESGNYKHAGDSTCYFVTPELKAIVLRAEKEMSFAEKRSGICREVDPSIFEIPADIQFTDACVGDPYPLATARRQFEAILQNSQGSALLACDTGMISATGFDQIEKIEYLIKEQNCGRNGSGLFSISARSKVIENTCATITHAGVTFHACEK